jgi:hypothetical protein
LVEEIGLQGRDLQEIEEAAEEEDEELRFSRQGKPCYWYWFGFEGGADGSVFFIDAIVEVFCGGGEGGRVGEGELAVQ